MALVTRIVDRSPNVSLLTWARILGDWEGVIARQTENGFAMTIAATPRKRDKLAAQLTWLANCHILGLPEDRRHGRITPRDPAARLVLPNGVNVACRLIHISQSGAAYRNRSAPRDRGANYHR